MTDDIHTCSYHCDRPECIRAQRDELRDELAKLRARIEEAPSISTEVAASLVEANLQDSFKDKRVRLLVEDGE